MQQDFYEFDETKQEETKTEEKEQAETATTKSGNTSFDSTDEKSGLLDSPGKKQSIKIMEEDSDTDIENEEKVGLIVDKNAPDQVGEIKDEDVDWSGDNLAAGEDDEKKALLDGETKDGEGGDEDEYEIDPETGKKKKKKKKKESKKARLLRLAKAENAAKLAAWEKEGENNCFDLDSEISFKPEDFEEEYLRDRIKYGDELEDVMGDELEPFEKIDLYTGQAGGIKLFGAARRQVGTIKGLWSLRKESEHPFGNGLTALVQTRTMCVRVYVLNGIHLISTDRDNSSDPYLIVRLGDTKYSTRKRYIKNTLEPKFHESFEFMSRLPGASKLKIEVWDWDGIGDDLVGSTTIDIEDRWFSKEWRKMKIKPLEERTLHNPRSSASFGKLRLWIDIFTKDEARNFPMTDISLPPSQEFELRCIVWDAKDVVIKDTVTDQNDLRVIGKFNVEGTTLKQETDIHWRAKSGKGSWNWRMIFPVTLPITKRCNLQFSMWDQDVFSANDSIGEINMSLDIILIYLHKQFEKCGLNRLILRKNSSKLFWNKLTHPKFGDGKEAQAKLKLSIELMHKSEVEKFPAGLARGDPNTNPFLPPPEGRFRWTINPFELLRQVLGNKLCFKLICICCLVGCCAIIIFFGPQLVVNLISDWFLDVVG